MCQSRFILLFGLFFAFVRLVCSVRAPRPLFFFWGLYSFSSRLVIPLFIKCEQAGIATGGGGINGDHLLGGEAAQIVWASGLWPGAGQQRAAERLSANDGADHAAIDID